MVHSHPMAHLLPRRRSMVLCHPAQTWPWFHRTVFLRLPCDKINQTGRVPGLWPPLSRWSSDRSLWMSYRASWPVSWRGPSFTEFNPWISMAGTAAVSASAFKTTPLLMMDEAIETMKRAGAVTDYRPPASRPPLPADAGRRQPRPRQAGQGDLNLFIRVHSTPLAAQKEENFLSRHPVALPGVINSMGAGSPKALVILV